MSQSNSKREVVGFVGTLTRLGNALKKKVKGVSKRTKNGIRSTLRDLNDLLTPPSGQVAPIPIPINQQRRRRR